MSGIASFRTGYLDDALTDLPDVIRRAERVLAKFPDFDTLVGTGFSGALVTPSLAMALGKNFALVRKPNDGSHHNGRILGDIGERWIFVDDFVSSGATRTRVRDAINAETFDRGHSTTYVGDYLYAKWDLLQDRGVFEPSLNY